MEKINILEIAHGDFRLMTFENRVEKAIQNIDNALKTMPQEELETLLSLSGKEYLTQQRQLLDALLMAKSW